MSKSSARGTGASCCSHSPTRGSAHTALSHRRRLPSGNTILASRRLSTVSVAIIILWPNLNNLTLFAFPELAVSVFVFPSACNVLVGLTVIHWTSVGAADNSLRVSYGMNPPVRDFFLEV